MLDQLRGSLSLLNEEGEVGDIVDWGVAAAELGVASFPADYQDFVAFLGAGSIEGSLFVSIPRPGNPTAPLTVGRLPEEVLQSDSMNEWKDFPGESGQALTEILVWGQTNGADVLCWVASGPDPDRWPVAVWARQGGGWSVYECRMTEFLLRLLRADFEACPLSVTTLWGRGKPDS
ncbi:hypothetical protein L1856_31515 [Streptomyces sp. Tue 6430]|nr:hypothetical protein [Streptomyces sp. Tue 6430]